MHFKELDSNEVWAIDQNYLKSCQDFIARSDEGTLQALAKAGKSQANPEPAADGGVAVIPITGPIVKRDSIFSMIFGGTSIERIRTALEDAIDDDRVKSILFSIDSPGGTIGGIASLADYIHSLRTKKPIVSFTDGTMASAAFWIGSAASVIVAEKTASVGSIGISATHYDYSKSDEKMGLKRTYLSTGKFKTLGNPAEPLSAKGRDYFENQLNYFYSMFVDAVAQNRGVSQKRY